MLAGYPATEASARVALARARGACVTAAMPMKPFSLVVDLASEPVGPRWLRGAATLALLCGAALSLAPGMDVFSVAYANTVVPGREYQMNAMLGGGADPVGPESEADPLPLAKPVIASNGSVIRIQGSVTDGLYWSLRSAGVSPQLAADYLKALATRIDVGADVAPY
ncbi:MAG TPA: hypothetical protein VFO51_06275, partial [Sphingomicrobium sp.]|nr:hypothetical protein [Sphingomicrobium sp.]